MFYPLLLSLMNSVVAIPIILSTGLRSVEEHNCCISCGYTWCPDLEQCVRVWETYCKSLDYKL